MLNRLPQIHMPDLMAIGSVLWESLSAGCDGSQALAWAVTRKFQEGASLIHTAEKNQKARPAILNP
ncbi:hypothetical protein BG74_02790 [Sodalis-like endosymbiont of Proechinophthirus fluctus]|nr:hypothetical protein BG74_02790 [Sodalis-like endosymbiont of Proechinophthirus fluctus]